jgi:hypothetical protein
VSVRVRELDGDDAVVVHEAALSAAALEQRSGSSTGSDDR